jgi:NAD(P) transhydrogenase subunit alpha
MTARNAVAVAFIAEQFPERQPRGVLVRARMGDRCDCCVSQILGGLMDFISILSIFVLACFVGYYVVWSVTPALHTPLMSVTNAISSVIVVGALIAAAAAGHASSKWLGLAAVALASVNIFGGFAVTARMLAMYKKKERGK